MKHIINKKSLALLAALPIGAAVTSSCSDWLELKPQNIITIDQFWDEETDVVSSIAGCYSTLENFNCLERMMIWGEFRSENFIENGDRNRNINHIMIENIDASNPYTTWNEFYTVINRCNIIMHFAPEVSAKDPNYTASELGAHIAECTAIRSLCYFYLIRTFRDVPYTEEPYLNDLGEMAVAASSFEYILDQLIASLEKVLPNAIKRYPVTENSLSQYHQTGRITRDAIWAMLSEMYLWKGDYQSCIKYADLVINARKEAFEKDNKKSHDFTDTDGYPLISDRSRYTTDSYGYAFDSLFVEGASSETIFELAYNKRNDNMLCNGPVSYFYGNSTEGCGVVKPSDHVALDVKLSTPKVFNNKYDGRAYENFRYDKGKDAPTCVNKYIVQDYLQLGNPTKDNFYNNSLNWGSVYGTKGNDKASLNKSNWIIYRLTDIMLLKAEALTQLMSGNSGSLDEKDEQLCRQAFQLCNAVNKRSLYQYPLKDTLNFSNYKTKTAITDLVYDERNRELMFEGKRYYDLVRRARREGNTDYLRSKCKLKNADNASIIESFLTRMEAIYWPYNLEETKVNPYLKQNPAFGSGENSSFDKNY